MMRCGAHGSWTKDRCTHLALVGRFSVSDGGAGFLSCHQCARGAIAGHDLLYKTAPQAVDKLALLLNAAEHGNRSVQGLGRASSVASLHSKVHLSGHVDGPGNGHQQGVPGALVSILHQSFDDVGQVENP